MGTITQKRVQILFFETTPEELRKIADILEKGGKKQLWKTTFFLNEYKMTLM